MDQLKNFLQFNEMHDDDDNELKKKNIPPE